MTYLCAKSLLLSFCISISCSFLFKCLGNFKIYVYDSEYYKYNSFLDIDRLSNQITQENCIQLQFLLLEKTKVFSTVC